METLNIKIGGMTCGGCVSSVRQVLAALPGVREAEVDLDKATATVTFDPGKLSRSAIAAAIEAAGYDTA
jgi:copper chaperone